METHVFTPRDKKIIGSLVASDNPQLALQYLSKYKEHKGKAIDGNLHNLNYYFLSFCKRRSIEPLDIIGPLHKQDKVDTRRLFIGAMVLIYKPQSLFSPPRMENGIGQQLCILLRIDNGNMSDTIDEVKEWYCGNLYEFRDLVDNVVAGLVGCELKKVA